MAHSSAVIHLDLNASYLRGTVVREGWGTVSAQLPTAVDAGAIAVFDQVLELLDIMVTGNVTRIEIDLEGLVDEEGVVRAAHGLGEEWIGMPLALMVEQACGIRTVVSGVPASILHRAQVQIAA